MGREKEGKEEEREREGVILHVAVLTWQTSLSIGCGHGIT